MLSSLQRTVGTERAVTRIAILLCCVITFIRWPELLLNAQFWGEDGWNWWPEARTIGLPSLWLPHTGYLQTIDRIVAIISLPFPLTFGPTIFAVAAFIFQVLPPLFLISSRGASLCPSLFLRCAIGLAWCAIPNAWEGYGNLTNSQWHLCILSFLIVMSAAPRRVGEWIFDCSMLAVGALSGPFSLVLAPVAALRVWQERSKASVIRFGLIAIGAIIQGLLIHATQRGIPPNLGASPIAFVRLISSQVVLALMVGHTHLPSWYQLGLWQIGVLPWMIFLVALWLSLSAMYRWPVMRMALLLTVLLLIACLSHPLGSGDNTPVWRAMLSPDCGVRYLSDTCVFWITVVVVQAFAAPWGWPKAAAIAILAIMVTTGIPHDWRMPVEPDRGFYVIAHDYDKAPKGSSFTLPVRPGNQTTYIK